MFGNTVLGGKTKMTAMNSQKEEWPITFERSSDAVAWAERFLFAERPNQLSMVPSAKKDGRRVSLQEMIDIAHTISAEVSRVRYPARAVYRYVHGRSMIQIDVACMICQRIWAKKKRLIGTKHENTCVQLALLLLDDRRKVENMGGRQMPVEKIARHLGLSRRSVYNHWMNDIRAIRNEIDRLLSQGDTVLDIQYSALGVFG